MKYSYNDFFYRTDSADYCFHYYHSELFLLIKLLTSISRGLLEVCLNKSDFKNNSLKIELNFRYAYGKAVMRYV